MNDTPETQKAEPEKEIGPMFKRGTWVEVWLVQPKWYADEIISEQDEYLHRAMIFGRPTDGEKLVWVEGNKQHISSELSELRPNGDSEITFKTERRRKYKMRISSDQGKQEVETPTEAHGLLSWVRKQFGTIFKK